MGPDPTTRLFFPGCREGIGSGRDGTIILCGEVSSILCTHDVFHTSLATRYGLPVYDSAGEPCSACLEGRARKNREEAANPSIKKRARIPTGTQDALGAHALNCRYGGGATRRHNALRDGVQAAARRGGFRAETELYIGSDPSSRKRDTSKV